MIKYVQRLVDENIIYDSPMTLTNDGMYILSQLEEWEYQVDNEGVDIVLQDVCMGMGQLTADYVRDTYRDIRDGKYTFDEIVKATRMGNDEDCDLI